MGSKSSSPRQCYIGGPPRQAVSRVLLILSLAAVVMPPKGFFFRERDMAASHHADIPYRSRQIKTSPMTRTVPTPISGFGSWGAMSHMYWQINYPLRLAWNNRLIANPYVRLPADVEAPCQRRDLLAILQCRFNLGAL
jgi:hypothetical protein